MKTNELLRALRTIVMKRVHEMPHQITPMTESDRALFDDCFARALTVNRLEEELAAARATLEAESKSAVDRMAAAHGIAPGRLCVHVRTNDNEPEGWHLLPEPEELARTDASSDIASLAASTVLDDRASLGPTPHWATELAEKIRRGEA